jgi:hypothetical protein
MLLLCLALAAFVQPRVVPLSVAAFLALMLYLFHSLTVEVDPDRMVVRFGPGLIRKSFPVQRIREAEVVRNQWYYGWGIRLTPHGWLFNVSGLEAVQIRLDNGRQYRVGTDQPDELVAALRTVAPLVSS